MKFANMKELKENTSAILALTDKGEDIVVTYRGKPRAMLHRLAEEDLEDYIIANSPKIKQILETAEKDFQQGKFKTLEEYTQERKLDIAK